MFPVPMHRLLPELPPHPPPSSNSTRQRLLLGQPRFCFYACVFKNFKHKETGVCLCSVGLCVCVVLTCHYICRNSRTCDGRLARRFGRTFSEFLGVFLSAHSDFVQSVACRSDHTLVCVVVPPLPRCLCVSPSEHIPPRIRRRSTVRGTQANP